MNALIRLRRLLSSVSFGLVIALLLLPLASTSACGQTLNMSGADLATVAPSLLVHHVWYGGGWAYVLFDLVPLFAAAGLAIQAFVGRPFALVGIGLSTLAFVALVIDLFSFPRIDSGADAALRHASGLTFPTLMAISAQNWQWKLAYYGLTAVAVIPAVLTAGELIASARTGAPTITSRLAVPARAGGIAGLLGAAAVVGGSWLPYAHYTGPGSTGYPSIFNAGFPGSLWYAVEPVAAAVLGLSVSALLVVRPGRPIGLIAAGVLLALGIQTFALFLGYAGSTPYAEPNSQIGIGSFVGMIGGLCMGAAGLLALAGTKSSARAVPLAQAPGA